MPTSSPASSPATSDSFVLGDEGAVGSPAGAAATSVGSFCAGQLLELVELGTERSRSVALAPGDLGELTLGANPVAAGWRHACDPC